MQLSTILEHLTYGELKQMSVGGYEGGAIAPANYPEVFGHINLALAQLYTRFPVKESSLVLMLKENIFEYFLRPEFALSQNPDGYIVDTVENPFVANIGRIEAAMDTTGNKITLNKEDTDFPIVVSSFDRLNIPSAVGDELITLHYRTKPTLLTLTTALDDDIYLPYSLLEPLLAYVEYRVHKSRGGEAGIAASFAAKQQYEFLCGQLEKDNVLNTAPTRLTSKFEDRGFV